MKRYGSMILFVITLVTSGVVSFSQEMSIIPKPAEIHFSEGEFIFGNQTSLIFSDAEKQTADYLQMRLKEGLGMVLAKGNFGDRKNSLVLSIDKAAGLGKEGYSLEIAENIVIKATEQQGLFYGVQSLLQLLPAEVFGDGGKYLTLIKLPAITILDRPRFQYRGFMLDISRHFFPKKDICKLIDMMAMHKLNVLHLHLTDDHGWRIEIKQYPKLTSIGATGDFSNSAGPEKYFLTQDEIREIVAFAAERHITVVPEIEMPGHSGAARKAYPEFFDGGNVYNPANPEVYTFIENIMNEVIALFPSPYVHFGGDEVSGSTNWPKMPDIQQFISREGLKTLNDVEGYFDRKIASLLIRKGKIPVGWEEVIDADVSKETVIQWWLGHLSPPVHLNKALDKGHKVIMSPNWYVYFDYAQVAGDPGAPWNGNINGPNSLELIYNWEPVPDTLSREKEALILGIEAPLWTEFIKTAGFRDYMTYPRMAALAEINWIPRGSKNLKQFHTSLQKQYMRYKAAGVKYRAPGWIGDVNYLIH